MDSQPVPPISQGPSEPNVWLPVYFCAVSEMYYNQRMLSIAVTFLLPLRSQMEGFWSCRLWFPPLSRGTPCANQPSSAKRQWIVERAASLCPGLSQCFLWWKWDQSLRWSSWGYRNHTCFLQDCHGPWPYGGSWPQTCKQEFPAMVRHFWS